MARRHPGLGTCPGGDPTPAEPSLGSPGGWADPQPLLHRPRQVQGRGRARQGARARRGGAGCPLSSRTFCIHRLFHDDLHALHVVPVPEAVQGLAVLVSERQDLSHGLAGRRQAVLRALLRPSGLTGRPHSETGPTPRRAPLRDGPHSKETPREGAPWGHGPRTARLRSPERTQSF